MQFVERCTLVKAEKITPKTEGRNPYVIVTLLDKDYNVYRVMWRSPKDFPLTEVEPKTDYLFTYKVGSYNGRPDIALIDINPVE